MHAGYDVDASILVLDNDGRRIIGNYYDVFPTLKEQTAFEKSLFSKTSKANAEVLMLDGLTVLYRSNVDLYFYVLAGPQVNKTSITTFILVFIQTSINYWARWIHTKKQLFSFVGLKSF